MAAAPKPPTPRPAPVSARGAVDLSTYGAGPRTPAPRTAPGGGAAPSAAPAPAGGGPAGAGAVGSLPPGSFSVEVTEETFQVEVLERSMQVPVVLDLWATWCEPCKALSPVLERLADEYGGRFVLATVDVDAEQRIASALQVQSIPTVLAVLGGQLVPLFTGAVPEDQVRAVLAELLKVAAEGGVTGLADPRPVPGAAEDGPPEPEPVEDPRFTAAEEALEDGDHSAAEAAYRRILAEEPDNAEAAVALQQVRLLARTADIDPAVVLAAAAAAPGDLDAGLAAADVEMADGRADAAFARLVALVRSSAGADRDRVRSRLLDFFLLAGPEDPRVAPARVALANALY